MIYFVYLDISLTFFHTEKYIINTKATPLNRIPNKPKFSLCKPSYTYSRYNEVVRAIGKKFQNFIISYIEWIYYRLFLNQNSLYCEFTISRGHYIESRVSM